jgi:hypothetical protein
MQIGKEMLHVGRVLHEDNDFVTMEIGKHDDVKFTLGQNEEGEIVGGDRFLTILFVHNIDGHMEVWKPWEK